MRAKYMVLGAAMWVFAAGCGSGKAQVTTAASAAPPPAPPPQPAQTAAPPLAVAAPEAVIEGDRIKIAKTIFYDVDKDQIRPESFPTLNAVAQILNTHPEIIGMTVEGHTDDHGSVPHNLKLSERRANAVVRYLVLQGGVKTPMTAPGYGASAPLCNAPTEECRSMNRRVEFKIKTK